MGAMVAEGGGLRNGRRPSISVHACLFGAAFRRAFVSVMHLLMLTAILLAYDAPGQALRRDAVARSLASLVDACVQGLVADAVLVGAPGRGLEHVADEAGCALVEAQGKEEGLARALDIARHEEALLLFAGHAVERGFVDEVNDAFAYGAGGRSLVLRAAPASFVTRLAPSLAEPVGIIARKSAFREAATANLRRLSRRLRCSELGSGARRTF
jgi:hypothetical protein